MAFSTGPFRDLWRSASWQAKQKNNPSGNPRYIRDLEGKRKHRELEDDVDLGKGFVGCAILTIGMLFRSATVDKKKSCTTWDGCIKPFI